jgi:hypothetical protein
MSFRDAFVRADLGSLGRPSDMVKALCIGMTAAACLAVAADAADLSMTPIYQTRPSAAATPDRSVKDQSRLFGVPDGERFKLSPATRATTRTDVPPGGRFFWTGVYDRF